MYNIDIKRKQPKGQEEKAMAKIKTTRKADGTRRRWCKPSRPTRGGRSWVTNTITSPAQIYNAHPSQTMAASPPGRWKALHTGAPSIIILLRGSARMMPR